MVQPARVTYHYPREDGPQTKLPPILVQPPQQLPQPGPEYAAWLAQNGYTGQVPASRADGVDVIGEND